MAAAVQMSRCPVSEAQDIEASGLREILNTPRCRDVQRRLGFHPSDLQIKRYEDFCGPGILPETSRVRFNHYEMRRQERLNEVLSEREKVITEGLAKKERSKEISSLALMEGLIDCEAKKLEKDLRSELRYYASIERENQNHLEKERLLQQRRNYRMERNQIRETMLEQRGKQVRHVEESKQNRALGLRGELQEMHEERQREFLRQHMEHELRARQLAEQKESRDFQKIEMWKQKLEEIEKKQEDRELDRRQKAEEYETRYVSKLLQYDRKKKDESRMRQIRISENELRYTDQQDRRQRLERQREYKKEQVLQHIKDKEEVVDTMEELKQHLVEKRKRRLMQQSACRARALNLTKLGPSPAEYVDHETVSCLKDGNGPVMLESSVDDFVTAAVKEKRHVPGPGNYSLSVLPQGQRLWEGTGAVIQKANVPTFSDVVIRATKDVPGPGRYECSRVMEANTSSVKLSADYFRKSGTPPHMILPSRDNPGPGTYAVDPYLRHAQKLKQNRSLSTLHRSLA